MKIDLLGMILAHAGHKPFDGLVIDDDGRELGAVETLDLLMREYGKVRGGGSSDIVVVSPSVSGSVIEGSMTS